MEFRLVDLTPEQKAAFAELLDKATGEHYMVLSQPYIGEKYGTLNGKMAMFILPESTAVNVMKLIRPENYLNLVKEGKLNEKI